MYGQSGRVGLIVPSPNTVVEPEFRALLPDGVEAYSSRCLYPETNNEKVKYEFYRRIEPLVLKAAREVASIKPNLIVWACTLGSLLPGEGSDVGLSRAIAEETGFPAMTTTTAVLEYLRRFKLGRIGLLTPYTEFFTDKMKAYLTDRLAGLEIPRTCNLGIVEGYAKAAAGVQELSALVRNLAGREAGLDGVFVSCTNMPTLHLVELATRELGIRVFSSTTATAWYALERMGLAAAAAGVAGPPAAAQI